jgi:methyl-accepting chemotaxis protein
VATQEIAKNVAESARGTAEVTQTIGGLSHSAATNEEAATRVLGASKNLAGDADKLNRELAAFLGDLQADR